MLRLETLTIRKLGNIAPDTELRFSARGALLLGKNGTGKTTLLNVITMALSSEWRRLAEMSNDGFDLTYALRFTHADQAPLLVEVTMRGASIPSEGRLQFLLSGRHDSHILTVAVRDSEETPLVQVTSKGDHTELAYRDGTTSKRPMASPSVADALIFGDDTARTPIDNVRLLDELRDLTQGLHRFDEAHHYFENLTYDDREDLPRVSFFQLGKLIDKTAFKSDLFSKSTCRAMRDLFNASPDVPDRIQLDEPPAGIVEAERPLPWLSQFCELAHIDKMSITFELISSKTSSGATISEYGPMALRYTMHGTKLRGYQLSFGQKRLFALLHYLDAHESIVLADEMVNGLHHEWIERCLDAASTRQSFLSSQNPILFDFMSFSSAQDAADRFIECSLDEQGRFVWRNMSLDDGNSFFELYQTGVQYVSEILQTRGYW